MRSRSLSTCRAGFCTTPDSGSGTGCVPTQRRGCGSSDVRYHVPGCPDHQPARMTTPGTSEQLALCAVKHLEFDYSKRCGSTTRTVGRSYCKRRVGARLIGQVDPLPDVGVSAGRGVEGLCQSPSRGSIRLSRIGAVTSNKRGVWQAEAWRRRSERVGCGSRARRSALFRVRRLGPPGARRPSWPAGTGAVVGRRFRRRVALRPLTRA
jgi:hypothetical protein